MSEIASENRPVVQDPVPDRSGLNRTQMIVLGLVALAAAALLAWQFIGCASCYAPIYTGT